MHYTSRTRQLEVDSKRPGAKLLPISKQMRIPKGQEPRSFPYLKQIRIPNGQEPSSFPYIWNIIWFQKARSKTSFNQTWHWQYILRIEMIITISHRSFRYLYPSNSFFAHSELQSELSPALKELSSELMLSLSHSKQPGSILHEYQHSQQ